VNHFENRYIHKDGSLVPIEWSARWDEKDQIRYGIARDVTEKKRLEKAFEIERQQFFELFSEAPSSMGVLSGPDHRFVMANPLYLKLIGKEDIIGKSVKEVLPEIAEQGFIELLDSVYQTGKTFSANEMLIKLDVENNGKPVDRYLNFMYQAHKDNDGKTDGILFFAVDVSEQVLSRKKIEESESRLKEAQALSHIRNWGVDLITGVNTWSDEFYYICGIKTGDIQPSPEAFISFIHPEDAAYVKEAIRKAFETFVASHFYSRIITPDGITKYIYSEWEFELDENNKPIRLYGILQDVTERKLAEESLKKSENRFRDFFESAPGALVVVPVDTLHFIRYNDNALKLLKYSPEEMLKIGPVEISPEFQPDGRTSREKAMEMTMNVMKGEKPVLDWLIKDANGKEIMCELRLVLLSSVDSPIVLASFVDITERKEAAKKLEQQNKELLKANTELDRFVYSTSHDLRAPLTSLLGLIDIVSENPVPAGSMQQGQLQMMKQSVFKLDNFIQDILQYSRNSRTEVALEEINFEEIVQEIRGEHKFMEGAKGFNLKVEIKQGIKFTSDMRRVNVILNNLISNAIKYRDNEKENPFLKIVIRCSKENAIIEIEDNGIGIAAKDKEKVFEMFFRATKTSTGSGLGLYIVKEAIEKIGGSITLESELNTGSKFTVTIPNHIATLN
ncbi:MAG: PAS domain S-box protein, partial [Bacteroidia bacterium]|nr:PAS domain S-box protein [Bacteroidia bacterium]